MFHSLSCDGFPTGAAKAGQCGQKEQQQEGDADAQDQAKNQGFLILQRLGSCCACMVKDAPVCGRKRFICLGSVFDLHSP